MSLSKKSSQINETKSSVPSKAATTLNPNAAEFIPFAHRASPLPPGSTSNAPDAAARFASSGTIGKAVLDRSESSASNKSDEEAQQYWRHQLPDDITPDFKVMADEESQVLGGLSLAGLSLHDGAELSRFPASAASGYVLTEQQQPSPRHINGGSFGEKMRYAAAASYREDPASANFLNLPNKPWDKQVVNTNQLLANGGEVHQHLGNSRQGLMNDILADPAVLDGMDMNPLEFLALQFPGFAGESLAEVYVTNRCDLNHTIEMLTQLELQVDGSFNQNMNSNAFSAPNLSAQDFPALTVPDSHNGPSKFAGNETGNSHRSPDKDNMLLFKSSPSFLSRDAVDFASAGRKLSSEDSGLWKYGRNGSTDFTVGSSRSSHVLAGTYNSGHRRGIYADRLQSRSSARTAPVWLETGDAVANMYSELREEARDHARLRNVYFEQAQQAFLIGNKALSKELSVKGQLHNMHMKAAHGKAQEAIYRQRNPVGLEIQGNGRVNERMIDLHGLHVSEAIHVLKHELSVLRSTARAAEQPLQVYICVGTGHHIRGSHTPARLPIAVQRYLLEEEGLDYTEPRPGLLRVVIH